MKGHRPPIFAAIIFVIFCIWPILSGTEISKFPYSMCSHPRYPRRAINHLCPEHKYQKTSPLPHQGLFPDGKNEKRHKAHYWPSYHSSRSENKDRGPWTLVHSSSCKVRTLLR